MAQRSFRIGGLHVGVRVNTSELDAALTACLRDVSVKDLAAPPNFAIRREDEVGPGSRPRYRVYIGCGHATTTRTLERSLAILFGFMEHHLPQQPQAGQLQIVAGSFIKNQFALLAPWQTRRGLPTIEARLERDGIQMLEQRSVNIDVASKEVVVGPPLLPPMAQRDGIEPAIRARRALPGRYPLKGWLLWRGWRWDQLTPAIATAYGLSISSQPADPQEALRVLADLVVGLPLMEVDSEADLSTTVRGVFD